MSIKELVMNWLTKWFKVEPVVTEEDLKPLQVKIEDLSAEVRILQYKVEVLLNRPIVAQYDLTNLTQQGE